MIQRNLIVKKPEINKFNKNKKKNEEKRINMKDRKQIRKIIKDKENKKTQMLNSQNCTVS